jgi:hypothetical protein
MKTVLVILLFILGIFAALAIGGGLLTLLAYGVGRLLNFVMHFDPFQATLISLAGMLIFGILTERIWTAMTSFPPFSSEYDDDDEEENEDDAELAINPSIPLWRQPLKNIDFSNAKPDDRCPCGSGRKYKNCHGAKRLK